MKKILFTICLLFTLCATLVTGCNLVSRNNAAYYAQTVAKAGDVTVTMQELIYGFNSFGYQYVNEGKTNEEAIKQTLTDLIEKKLFVNHFKDNSSVQLTTSEKNYLLYQAHRSINSSIATLENEVKIEWGALEIADSEEQQNSANIYTAYDEVISFDGESFVHNGSVEPLGTLNVVPTFSFTSFENANVKSEARRRYFETLRSSAKSLGKLTLSNEVLLQEEINRIYDAYVESATITKINNNYLSTFNGSISTFNNEVFDYFKRAVSNEKTTLMLKGVGTGIGSLTVADVEALNYYCPTVVSENFFEVVHILIPFDDEYSAQLEELEASVKQGLTDESAVENFKEEAKDSIKIKGRNETTGERTEDEKTPNQILQLLTDALSVESSSVERQRIFREFMFKYSSDDATLTSEKNYVIPVNSSLDTMVSEFATEARRLKTLGEQCSVGNIVNSTYGCHIIMFLGDVEKAANENTEIDDNHKEELLQRLYDLKLKSGHNKSTYHLIYETIINNLNTFETYYDERVAFEKNKIVENGGKIVIYTNRIKSLWE